MITAVGIDPGLANLGMAGVQWTASDRPYGTYSSRGMRVIRTEKEQAQAFTRLRTSADDVRRNHELFLQIREVLMLLQPHCVGVENYHVMEPQHVKQLREVLSSAIDAEYISADSPTPASTIDQIKDLVKRGKSGSAGLGQAARTLPVYGCVLACSFALEIPVFVFEPGDRGRRLLMKKSGAATKLDVEEYVLQHVEGFAADLDEKVPQKTLRNHACDAGALAMLAIQEYRQMRLDLGAKT